MQPQFTDGSRSRSKVWIWVFPVLLAIISVAFPMTPMLQGATLAGYHAYVWLWLMSGVVLVSTIVYTTGVVHRLPSIGRFRLVGIAAQLHARRHRPKPRPPDQASLAIISEHTDRYRWHASLDEQGYRIGIRNDGPAAAKHVTVTLENLAPVTAVSSGRLPALLRPQNGGSNPCDVNRGDEALFDVLHRIGFEDRDESEVPNDLWSLWLQDSLDEPLRLLVNERYRLTIRATAANAAPISRTFIAYNDGYQGMSFLPE